MKPTKVSTPPTLGAIVEIKTRFRSFSMPVPLLPPQVTEQGDFGGRYWRKSRGNRGIVQSNILHNNALRNGSRSRISWHFGPRDSGRCRPRAYGPTFFSRKSRPNRGASKPIERRRCFYLPGSR